MPLRCGRVYARQIRAPSWIAKPHEIRNEIQAGNKRGNDMFMKEKNGKVPWEEEIKS
jgi:hypothetical protein